MQERELVRFVVVRPPEQPVTSPAPAGVEGLEVLSEVYAATEMPTLDYPTSEMLGATFDELLRLEPSRLRSGGGLASATLSDVDISPRGMLIPPSVRASVFIDDPTDLSPLAQQTFELLGVDPLELPYRVLVEEVRYLAYLSLPSPGSQGSSLEAVSVLSGDWPRLRVGDLYTTQKTWERYVPGEVSHIENVLKNEFRERVHERTLERFEETRSTTEVREEEVSDLTSTEKAELESEVQTELSSKKKAEAGARVSASYGPFVSAEVYGNIGQETSAEQSERTARKFSSELIERAVSRIERRVKEERVKQIKEVIRESNVHRIDNVGGGSVSGIYRWVDQELLVEKLLHGRRLILEIDVLEPGRRLLEMRGSHDALTSSAISNLDIAPSRILPSNWSALVKRYRVQGFDSPPPLFKDVAWTAKGKVSKGADPLHVATSTLSIPEGYEAYAVTFSASYTNALGNAPESHEQLFAAQQTPVGPVYSPVARGGKPPTFTVQVGRHYQVRQETVSGFRMGLELDTALIGEAPVAVHARHVRSYAIAVTLHCRLTTGAWQRWQLKAYDAIVSAAISADAAANEGFLPNGDGPTNLSPTKKRDLEDSEFQRLATVFLRGEGSEAIPGSSSAELSEFVAGFRDHFEWGDMAVELHGPETGREETWQARVLAVDSDPGHEAFLRAGSATLKLPVRPGREAYVLYGLVVGQWLDPDDVMVGMGAVVLAARSSDLDYKRMLTLLALANDLDANPPEEQEPVVVDSWPVRVATSLRWLQSSSELPLNDQASLGSEPDEPNPPEI